MWTRRLISGRYLLLAAWAAAWGAALWGRVSDWLVFEIGSRVLISYDGHYAIPGGPLHLYDQFPQMQIGPPALAVTALTQLPGPTPGRVAAAVLMTAIGVWCVAAAELLARTSGVDPARAAQAALLGGLPLLACWATLATWAMHLDDALVLAATAGAAVAVGRQRWAWVGLLTGLAAATKPWAIVILALVFALPRPQWAKAGLLAVIAAVGPWTPFVFAAPQSAWALAGYHIPVEPGSTLALFLDAGSPAPGLVRPLQFGVGLLVAVWAVRRGRWWCAPYLAFCVRVLADPAVWPYYGVAIVAAALLCDARAGRRLPWLTVVAAVAEFAVPLLVSGAPAAVIRIALLVASLPLAAQCVSVTRPPSTCSRRVVRTASSIRRSWVTRINVPV